MNCPKCDVTKGKPHTLTCRLALCETTQLPRTTCPDFSPNHCGRDAWGTPLPPLPPNEPKTEPAPIQEQHPNTGPCSKCGADAPRYNNGWNGKASPLCPTCQNNLTTWREQQRTKK